MRMGPAPVYPAAGGTERENCLGAEHIIRDAVHGRQRRWCFEPFITQETAGQCCGYRWADSIMEHNLTQLVQWGIGPDEAEAFPDVVPRAEARSAGKYLAVLLAGPPDELVSLHGRAVFGITTEDAQPLGKPAQHHIGYEGNVRHRNVPGGVVRHDPGFGFIP